MYAGARCHVRRSIRVVFGSLFCCCLFGDFVKMRDLMEGSMMNYLIKSFGLLIIFGFCSAQDFKHKNPTLTEEDPISNSSLIPVTESCDTFIEEYSKSTANYTSCIVLHARPFTVCRSCYSQYLQCQSIYEILLRTTSGNRGPSCAQKIAHDDYVQMIVRVHDFIEDSWTSNYCSGCYGVNNSRELSNSTTEFLERLTMFNKCIFDKMEQHSAFIVPGKMSVNKTVCNSCFSSYKNLSDFYSTLDPYFDGHFCMDLSDAMNFTWNLWHESFKCPANKPELTISICISIVLSVLPILFYLLAKICGSDITKIFLREKRLQPGWSFSSNSRSEVYTPS